MVKYDIANVKKQVDILKSIYPEKTTTNDNEVKTMICNKILEVRDDNNLDDYNISVSIKNNTTIPWKNNKKEQSLFVKVYYNEIDYVRSHFGLTMTEMGFLLSLTPYLLYEYNLLVDKNGNPINQKTLMELLGYGKTAISKMINSLERKKCLIRIWYERETYFIINPFIMLCGTTVDKRLPELFTTVGYIPMNE